MRQIKADSTKAPTKAGGWETRGQPAHGPPLNGYLRRRPVDQQTVPATKPATLSWWVNLTRDQFAARLKEKRS